jgi:hypothetical protein
MLTWSHRKPLRVRAIDNGLLKFRLKLNHSLQILTVLYRHPEMETLKTMLCEEKILTSCHETSFHFKEMLKLQSSTCIMLVHFR